MVIETAPGRIEAVRPRLCRGCRTTDAADAAATAHDPAELRATLTPQSRPRTPPSGANQRIAAWRLRPDDDFPRTHTLKVKRTAIREWVAAEAPLPVR